MNALSVGSIVRCRNREWIILPSPDENLLLLRPLTDKGKISFNSKLQRKIDRLKQGGYLKVLQGPSRRMGKRETPYEILSIRFPAAPFGKERRSLSGRKGHKR
jgi:hypothetical protein